jgi:hypothetical protein
MKIKDIKAKELVNSSKATERSYFYPALSKHKLPQITKPHGKNPHLDDLLNIHIFILLLIF